MTTFRKIDTEINSQCLTNEPGNTNIEMSDLHTEEDGSIRQAVGYWSQTSATQHGNENKDDLEITTSGSEDMNVEMNTATNKRTMSDYDRNVKG